MGNGDIIVLPHDFENLSSWYYQLWKLKVKMWTENPFNRSRDIIWPKNVVHKATDRWQHGLFG
jgi:hypothetical protein